MPPDPYTNESLARGITWAVHPEFCEKLLPFFPENKIELEWMSQDFAQYFQFLSCGQLREAIAAALDAWALNHQQLYFSDVTNACAAPGAIVNNLCHNAEIFIVPSEGSEVEDSITGLAAFAHPQGAQWPHPFILILYTYTRCVCTSAGGTVATPGGVPLVPEFVLTECRHVA